jgi:hypothetical protein
MKKITFTMSTANFAKAHKKLKQFEIDNDPIKIGSSNLSSFLLSTIRFDDSQDSKIIRTKRRILHVAGDFGTDPSTLQGSIDLKTNLHYGDTEYLLLQVQLDRLVKEYKSTASISKTEMDASEKVKDCVKLVNDKTTIPI